jgi:hypothetical protein
MALEGSKKSTLSILSEVRQMNQIDAIYGVLVPYKGFQQDCSKESIWEILGLV